MATGRAAAPLPTENGHRSALGHAFAARAGAVTDEIVSSIAADAELGPRFPREFQEAIKPALLRAVLDISRVLADGGALPTKETDRMVALSLERGVPQPLVQRAFRTAHAVELEACMNAIALMTIGEPAARELMREVLDVLVGAGLERTLSISEIYAAHPLDRGFEPREDAVD